MPFFKIGAKNFFILLIFSISKYAIIGQESKFKVWENIIWTVWKLHILREINFGELQTSKIVTLTISEAVIFNFDFFILTKYARIDHIII